MTMIESVGEFGLIARMSRRLARTAAVQVGLGDDAAVLAHPVVLGRGARRERLLLASDMIVEGVHFDRRTVPPHWIGWKALACNVSDIAAMGGRPCAAVVSLGLPRQTPVRFVDALYQGLSRCAKRFGVAIVGGDTVRAPCVVMDVAILGIARPEHVTLRSTARVGDLLFMTGRVGGSRASGRHARVWPRLREAQWLVTHLPVHAMIDLSDGLASDLWQMARASRVTLRVEADRIPIRPEVGRVAGGTRAATRRHRLSVDARALHHALMDGEDFELLFSVPRRVAARVPRRIGTCPVTRIGAVVGSAPSRTGSGVQARLRRGDVVRVQLQGPDGTLTPVEAGGFRHF